MIGFLDAATLAQAKLHTKRLLLLSTIIVSGLLFATLFAAVIISGGITKSINNYTQAALDGKYLVKSTPVIPQSVSGPSRINPSNDLIQELTALQTDYIASQKSLAARLKLPFDPSTIPPILEQDSLASKTLPEASRVMINLDSPVFKQYLQLLQQNYVKVAKNKLSDLKNIGVKYGATNYFQNEYASPTFQTMTYLKDGNEDLSWLSQTEPASSDASVYGYTTSSVRNSTYTFIDSSLVQRFILPVNKKRQEQSSAIPVVITTKEAIDLFGSQLHIQAEPTTVSQRVAWLKDLQNKINGFTYSTCYRNSSDSAAINQAIQTLSAIEANKNSSSYILPSLIYNLPATACGGLAVKSDTRTTAEKDAAAQQIATNLALGTYQTPVHQLLQFQIVGVIPVAQTTDTAANVQSFITSLFNTQYGVGAMIPIEMYNSLPAAEQYKNILQNDTTMLHNTDELHQAGIDETIISFASLNKARAFINNEGCPPSQDDCAKPFILEPYGTNYLLIDSLQNTINATLRVAFFVIATIATIIIWFMISRIISDSRHETAIFRAMGARRHDIAAIYTVYTFGVACRILLFAISIGVLLAYSLQIALGGEATDYAQSSYGLTSQGVNFSFINLESPLLLWLGLSIPLISYIAAFPALIRNVRRNPINDLRDE